MPPPPPAQSVVRGLLSPDEDRTLLLSHFRSYLEYDDIRYHTMQAATEAVARATDGDPQVSSGIPVGQGWVTGSVGLSPALAGATRLLEQCLLAAVCREPATPGGCQHQLLCPTRR